MKLTFYAFARKLKELEIFSDKIALNFTSCQNVHVKLSCRPLLKEIKESSVSQIILDCETDHILDILEQAQEVKLMEEYYSYILTSLVSDG